MSSQLSKTSTSFLSSSIEISNDEGYSSPFMLYQNQSGKKILQHLCELQSERKYYAGDKDVNTQCKFFSNGDVKEDVLIAKNVENSDTAFLLAGIFQIDTQKFFMTSDRKRNEDNQCGTCFEQIQPTCHLVPVQQDLEFKYSAEDFPTIVANIQAIENQVNARKPAKHVSLLLDNLVAIKLTHCLFVVRCSFFFFH